MNLFRITALLIIGVALQALLPRWAFTGSLDWPILTALLMVIVLHADRGAVIYAGVLAGFLYDVFSPAPLGVSIPFFLLVGVGLHMLKTELFSDQPITYCVLGVLTVSLKTLYFFVVLTLAGQRPILPGGLLAARVVGGFLLGAVTAPAVYLAVSLLLHKRRRRRRT